MRRKPRLSVKEAFDNLPAGLCFFNLSGLPVLCNRTIERLVFALTGRDLQHLSELTAALEQPAAGLGVTVSGSFGPEDDITREQLATILWRYDGSPAIDRMDSLAQFTDRAQVSGYAETAMQWAVKQSVISGKGDSILDPLGKATRAEVAQMLMNDLEK